MGRGGTVELFFFLPVEASLWDIGAFFICILRVELKGNWPLMLLKVCTCHRSSHSHNYNVACCFRCLCFAEKKRNVSRGVHC